MISIQVFFHLKNICLGGLRFLFTLTNSLKLFNSFIRKVWDILNLPFNLKFFLETSSLNRNERVACLECGREYTRKDASRHRRTCGVLKCSNCNRYTYSSDELTNHVKKKHASCQHNVKLCAQQSPNTLQEKVK